MDTNDLQWLTQRLEALLQMHDSRDYSALTAPAATHLYQTTMDAFASEKSPSGGLWVDLRPSTLKSRAAKGYGPGPKLVQSGDLLNSIEFDSDRRSAVVGSNVPYAELQNMGGMNEAGWMVPARPFLGVGDEDQLHAVLDQALSRLLDW